MLCITSTHMPLGRASHVYKSNIDGLGDKDTSLNCVGGRGGLCSKHFQAFSDFKQIFNFEKTKQVKGFLYTQREGELSKFLLKVLRVYGLQLGSF